MINWQIFKKAIRSNILLWIVLTITPALFINVIAITLERNHTPIASILDQAVFAALGVEMAILYSVITGNKLVVSEVQSGAITYVVASSVPRRTIIMTKMTYLIGSLFLTFLFELIATVPTIAILQNHIDLTVGAYIAKLIGLLLLSFATSGIVFIASSSFDKTLWSFIVGAGIPLVFFILYTLSGINKSLDFLKFFTMNSLFNEATVDKVNLTSSGAKMVLNSKVEQWLPQYFSLFAIGVGLYTGSGFIFCKRDLPL